MLLKLASSGFSERSHLKNIRYRVLEKDPDANLYVPNDTKHVEFKEETEESRRVSGGRKVRPATDTINISLRVFKITSSAPPKACFDWHKQRLRESKLGRL